MSIGKSLSCYRCIVRRLEWSLANWYGVKVQRNVTLSPKQSNNSPATRYQKGFVYLDRDKWNGRYREDLITGEGTKRIRREVILGCKREMTKPLAERRMEVVLARINGLDYRPRRAATFSEFIEGWKAQMLTTQKPSSARAVRSHLKCYILPELGNVRLDQFGVENQQTFINPHAREGYKEDRLSENSPERAGNLVNDSDDGPQLGLQL